MFREPTLPSLYGSGRVMIWNRFELRYVAVTELTVDFPESNGHDAVLAPK